MLSVKNSHEELVHYLVEHGCDCTVTKERRLDIVTMHKDRWIGTAIYYRIKLLLYTSQVTRTITTSSDTCVWRKKWKSDVQDCVRN